MKASTTVVFSTEDILKSLPSCGRYTPAIRHIGFRRFSMLGRTLIFKVVVMVSATERVAIRHH